MIPIPPGWTRVRNCKVERGDKIRSESGWVDAHDLLPTVVRQQPMSAVGHATALYECVIRKAKVKG